MVFSGVLFMVFCLWGLFLFGVVLGGSPIGACLCMLCFGGGESRRVSSCCFGYSEKVPNATGKVNSYLALNRDSLQKPMGVDRNHRHICCLLVIVCRKGGGG